VPDLQEAFAALRIVLTSHDVCSPHHGRCGSCKLQSQQVVQRVVRFAKLNANSNRFIRWSEELLCFLSMVHLVPVVQARWSLKSYVRGIISSQAFSFPWCFVFLSLIVVVYTVISGLPRTRTAPSPIANVNVANSSFQVCSNGLHIENFKIYIYI
jgi:hypothetical protein